MFLILCFLFPSLIALAQQTVPYSIFMRNISDKTMWDGTVLRVFGFAPNIGNVPVPGPTLICNEGDTLDVYVKNISQQNHHTVHWHGLDVPQNMDGVHETSFSFTHMMDTNLIFVAAHAGTFLYHCHVASVVHVQMGMYGSVIVRPADGSNTAFTGGPAFDRDYLWLMSEFDKYWHDSLPQADSLHDSFPVPPYEPDYFMVNGLSKAQITADTNTSFDAMVGEKIYLRLSNIGYCMNQVIFPSSFSATILSSDGRPLPLALQEDTIYVMPGERYEVMLTPSVEFPFSVVVNYLDVNTGNILETEFVPVAISGTIGRTEEETQNARIHLFPNPSSGKLTLAWEGLTDGPKTILISDLSGKKILNAEISAWQTEWEGDLSFLSAGSYFLSLHCGDKIYSQRFVIHP